MSPPASLPAAKPPKPPPPARSAASATDTPDDATPSPSPSVSTPLTAHTTASMYGALGSQLSDTSNGSASPPAKPASDSPSAASRSQNIAASTSFFGLPHSLSSASLRSTLGLPAASPGEIDWVSISVVYWITLVSEASRGLMLPSTWPYFNSLGGSKATLGVFVASFSMGRMSTTIPLGYFSDNFSTATVLSVASLLQAFGHLAYAVAPSLPVLYASRIVVGFGSATMSVCRAHLTRAIPSSIRTHHFAYLSALQFIGFAVLPGAGGLLALLPEYDPFPGIRLNGFTYPAYVLVLCNFFSMLLIYSLYFNPPENVPRRRTSPNTSSSTDPSDFVERGPDVLALVVCLLINVVFRGVVAEFETVSTPFLMEQFGLTYGGASFRISTIGFCGLFVYVAFKPIAKRFSDRALVVFGLLVVIAGCLPLSADVIADNLALPVYVACLGLTWSLAYPIGQTAVLSLFSKVLASLPAGGFLGVFSATGSVARVVFAMLAGTMWSQFGRESVFALILAYISLCAVLVACTYRRLIPAEQVF